MPTRWTGALLLLTLALSGCASPRCARPPEACLDLTVSTRDPGDGTTAIRIADVHASGCVRHVAFYCAIGVYGASAMERAFVFDPASGTLPDPIGSGELVLGASDQFGFTCVEIEDADVQALASCADADCGVASSEERARELMMEADDCRVSGFFVPITIR